ncbi:unnamed protein product [Cladocopium goreaui]|uniref:Polyadenylate-binding protein, cytoplasmic and nuclear (PABP) (Poly(A)-binding protein) (Polyadenylate tail-binding protein) n=1 Tax=Cladocopium goreaui TaxID=2562237 RepID=A0A9P1FH47_9DINO|nr:unnamed protein product [Cladocopium goreaui]
MHDIAKSDISPNLDRDKMFNELWWLNYCFCAGVGIGAVGNPFFGGEAVNICLHSRCEMTDVGDPFCSNIRVCLCITDQCSLPPAEGSPICVCFNKKLAGGDGWSGQQLFDWSTSFGDTFWLYYIFCMGLGFSAPQANGRPLFAVQAKELCIKGRTKLTTPMEGGKLCSMVSTRLCFWEQCALPPAEEAPMFVCFNLLNKKGASAKSQFLETSTMPDIAKSDISPNLDRDKMFNELWWLNYCFCEGVGIGAVGNPFFGGEAVNICLHSRCEMTDVGDPFCSNIRVCLCITDQCSLPPAEGSPICVCFNKKLAGGDGWSGQQLFDWSTSFGDTFWLYYIFCMGLGFSAPQANGRPLFAVQVKELCIKGGTKLTTPMEGGKLCSMVSTRLCFWEQCALPPAEGAPMFVCFNLLNKKGASAKSQFLETSTMPDIAKSDISPNLDRDKMFNELWWLNYCFCEGVGIGAVGNPFFGGEAVNICLHSRCEMTDVGDPFCSNIRVCLCITDQCSLPPAEGSPICVCFNKKLAGGDGWSGQQLFDWSTSFGDTFWLYYIFCMGLGFSAPQANGRPLFAVQVKELCIKGGTKLTTPMEGGKLCSMVSTRLCFWEQCALPPAEGAPMFVCFNLLNKKGASAKSQFLETSAMPDIAKSDISPNLDRDKMFNELWWLNYCFCEGVGIGAVGNPFFGGEAVNICLHSRCEMTDVGDPFCSNIRVCLCITDQCSLPPAEGSPICVCFNKKLAGGDGWSGQQLFDWSTSFGDTFWLYYIFCMGLGFSAPQANGRPLFAVQVKELCIKGGTKLTTPMEGGKLCSMVSTRLCFWEQCALPPAEGAPMFVCFNLLNKKGASAKSQFLETSTMPDIAKSDISPNLDRDKMFNELWWLNYCFCEGVGIGAVGNPFFGGEAVNICLHSRCEMTDVGDPFCSNIRVCLCITDQCSLPPAEGSPICVCFNKKLAGGDGWSGQQLFDWSTSFGDTFWLYYIFCMGLGFSAPQANGRPLFAVQVKELCIKGGTKLTTPMEGGKLCSMVSTRLCFWEQCALPPAEGAPMFVCFNLLNKKGASAKSQFLETSTMPDIAKSDISPNLDRDKMFNELWWLNYCFCEGVGIGAVGNPFFGGEAVNICLHSRCEMTDVGDPFCSNIRVCLCITDQCSLPPAEGSPICVCFNKKLAGGDGWSGQQLFDWSTSFGDTFWLYYIFCMGLGFSAPQANGRPLFAVQVKELCIKGGTKLTTPMEGGKLCSMVSTRLCFWEQCALPPAEGAPMFVCFNLLNKKGASAKSQFLETSTMPDIAKSDISPNLDRDKMFNELWWLNYCFCEGVGIGAVGNPFFGGEAVNICLHSRCEMTDVGDPFCSNIRVCLCITDQCSLPPAEGSPICVCFNKKLAGGDGWSGQQLFDWSTSFGDTFWLYYIFCMGLGFSAPQANGRPLFAVQVKELCIKGGTKLTTPMEGGKLCSMVSTRLCFWEQCALPPAEGAPMFVCFNLLNKKGASAKSQFLETSTMPDIAKSDISPNLDRDKMFNELWWLNYCFCEGVGIGAVGNPFFGGEAVNICLHSRCEMTDVGDPFCSNIRVCLCITDQCSLPPAEGSPICVCFNKKLAGGDGWSGQQLFDWSTSFGDTFWLYYIFCMGLGFSAPQANGRPLFAVQVKELCIKGGTKLTTPMEGGKLCSMVSTRLCFWEQCALPPAEGAPMFVCFNLLNKKGQHGDGTKVSAISAASGSDPRSLERANDLLGISVEAASSESFVALRVASISERGVVGQRNRTSTQQLREGDVILEINGVKEDVEAMRSELQEPCLKMLVRSTSRFETDEFGRKIGAKPQNFVLPHAEIKGDMPRCRCGGHCKCGLADALGRARDDRKMAQAQPALHIGNLHPEVSEEMLYDFFVKVAPVATVRVVRDTKTLESEYHGYVNFYTFQDAEKVLKTLDGAVVHGRRCFLSWSTRAKQTTELPLALPISSVAKPQMVKASLRRRCEAFTCDVLWEYHSPADPFQPKWTLPRTPPEVEERTECSSDMSGFSSERSGSVEVAVQTDEHRSDVHQRPKTPRRCLGILLLLATLAGLPQWTTKGRGEPLAFLPTLEVVQEVAASLQGGCQVNLTEMSKLQEALQECQLQGAQLFLELLMVPQKRRL